MNNISKDKKIIIDKDESIFVDGSAEIKIVESIHANVYCLSYNETNEFNIYLEKENSSIDFYYSTINESDNNLKVNVYHNAKNTESHVYNHGVNLENNNLHFDISGYVKKESIGSNCNQDNEIINIKSGKSTICPNLYIDCYDSNSNHSAYIGKFKDEEIFYLESRGLSKKKAYNLLMKSFLIPFITDSKEKDEYVKKIEKIGGELYE